MFIGRRLVFAVVLLLTVSFIVFALQAFSQDSLVATVLGNRPATPEAIARVRHEFRLDEPFVVRFVLWLGDALQLDFGRSIRSNGAVLDVISGRLPVTLQLVGLTLVLVVVVGVSLGLVAGVKQGTSVDRAITTASV